jgi:hypothetical protein
VNLHARAHGAANLRRILANNFAKGDLQCPNLPMIDYNFVNLMDDKS